MQYRRVYIQGGTYFFTLVTYLRRSIFASTEAIDLLRESIKYTQTRFPFTIVACVILPDHLHFIWTLPQDTSDYSVRWRMTKSHFSRHWIDSSLPNPDSSRAIKGEKEIWQRRFWEHLIQNEEDLEHHIDYIHYNPVKHGFVQSPSYWKYSSFSNYVNAGVYEPDWGRKNSVWDGNNLME